MQDVWERQIIHQPESSRGRNSELRMSMGVLASLEIAGNFAEKALDFSRVWNGRLMVVLPR